MFSLNMTNSTIFSLFAVSIVFLAFQSDVVEPSQIVQRNVKIPTKSFHWIKFLLHPFSYLEESLVIKISKQLSEIEKEVAQKRKTGFISNVKSRSEKDGDGPILRTRIARFPHHQITSQDIEVALVPRRLPISLGQANLLYDGKSQIYIQGGRNDNGFQNGIYSFDIHSETIYQVSTLPERILHGGVAKDALGNIFYFGANSPHKIYKFHPKTKKIMEVGHLEKSISEGKAVVKENLVYIIGGKYAQCFNMSSLTNCGVMELNGEDLIGAVIYEDEIVILHEEGGIVESLNLNDLIPTSSVVPDLPEWIYPPSITTDGDYLYGIGGVMGVHWHYKHFIFRLHLKSFKIDYVPVEYWSGNDVDYFYETASVYVEELNRIYVIGGYSKSTYRESLSGYRNFIWHVSLNPMEAFRKEKPMEATEKINCINTRDSIRSGNKVGALEGTNVTLECQIDALPSSIYFWVDDGIGMMIFRSRKYQMQYEAINSTKTLLRLTIRNLTDEDFGQYRCVSQLGESRAEFAIQLYKTTMPTPTPMPAEIKLDPNDPTKFKQCRNSILHTYTCPPRFTTDMELQECIYKEELLEVSCTYKPDGLYPHPNNSRMFIGCRNNTFEILECPDGLLFSPVSLKCTSPAIDECSKQVSFERVINSNHFTLEAIIAPVRMPAWLGNPRSIYDGMDTIYIIGANVIYAFNITSNILKSSEGDFKESGCTARNSAGDIFYFDGSKIYIFNPRKNVLQFIGKLRTEFDSCTFSMQNGNSDKVYLLGVAKHETFIQCYNMQHGKDCGTVGPLQHHYSKASFFHEGNQIVLQLMDTLKILNFKTLAWTSVGRKLPMLQEELNIVTDGRFGYIATGLASYPRNRLVRIDPKTFEYELLPVKNHPGRGYNEFKDSTNVYVEKLNRIYIIGGRSIQYELGFHLLEGHHKDIWYIDLPPKDAETVQEQGNCEEIADLYTDPRNSGYNGVYPCPSDFEFNATSFSCKGYDPSVFWGSDYNTEDSEEKYY